MKISVNAVILFFLCIYNISSIADSAADIFGQYSFTVGPEGLVNEIKISPGIKLCKIKTKQKVIKEKSVLAKQQLLIKLSPSFISTSRPGDNPNSRRFLIAETYYDNDIRLYTEYFLGGRIYPKHEKLRVDVDIVPYSNSDQYYTYWSRESNLPWTVFSSLHVDSLIESRFAIKFKPKSYKVLATVIEEDHMVKLVLTEKLALKIQTKEIDSGSGAMKNCVYSFNSVTRTFKSLLGEPIE